CGVDEPHKKARASPMLAQHSTADSEHLRANVELRSGWPSEKLRLGRMSAKFVSAAPHSFSAQLTIASFARLIKAVRTNALRWLVWTLLVCAVCTPLEAKTTKKSSGSKKTSTATTSKK